MKVWIFRWLHSLKVRLLLPVMLMMIAMVAVLTSIVTHTYTSTLLAQEDAKTQSAFEITGASIEKTLDTVSEVSAGLLLNESVSSYAEGNFKTPLDRVLTRQMVLTELDSLLARQPNLHGVLFIREDGSAFGDLSRRSFFFDEDSADILNQDMLTAIQSCTRGSTLWIGPMSGEELYRIKVSAEIPTNVMLGVTLSRSIRYGTVYAVAVLDVALLYDYLELLEDGRSNFYLTCADGTEIVRTGAEALDAEVWSAVNSE